MKIKNFLLVVVAIAGLLLLNSSSAQVSGPVLSIAGMPSTATIGDTFTARIELNTNGQLLDNVDIYFLRFNPAILQVQDSDILGAGVQIDDGILFPETVVNNADNTVGLIEFSQVFISTQTYNGLGTLATISFRAVGAGTSEINFDFTSGSTSDTNAVYDGQDKLVSVVGASVVVSGQGTPTPTPTPIPISTSVPAPTPTPAPAPGGGGCCSGGNITYTPAPSPTTTPLITKLTPISRGFVSLATLNLKEGDTVSASGSSDPDIYIANIYGYKRLFLNPIIFNFYGHLGGFGNVKKISSTTRDMLVTSGLYRNCETNDPKVYGVEVTGEDLGILHWVNTTGAQAIIDDPDFFKKVFCINMKEFNWYSKGSNYISVNQIPNYSR